MPNTPPAVLHRRPDHWRQGLAFLLSMLVLLVWLYHRDESPSDDSDLRIRGPLVPNDQNGFAQILKLPVATLDFPAYAKAHGVTDESTISQIYDGRTRNDALVDAFLAQARPAFTQLDTILALPHFEITGAIASRTKFPEINAALAAGQALRLSALRNLQKGDYAASTRDTLALRLLSLRLSEGYAYLTQYLASNTIYGFSAVCARDLLNDPALPVEQQGLLAASYAANEPTTAALQRSLAIEYQFGAAALDQQEREGGFFNPAPPSNFLAYLASLWRHYTLRPNTTRHELADYYRDWRSALNGTYADIDFPALDAERFGFAKNTGAGVRLTSYLAPNAGGRFFLSQTTISPDIVKYAYWEIAADRLLRTGFAIRHYYRDHDILPLTLTALVPDYLYSLPSMDGQPFHYDRAHGLIYSVGTSLLNTHGSRFLGLPPTTPNYIDPLADTTQPSLLLTFQKKLTFPPMVPPPPTPEQQMGN
jgi:hypothetical protein